MAVVGTGGFTVANKNMKGMSTHFKCEAGGDFLKGTEGISLYSGRLLGSNGKKIGM